MKFKFFKKKAEEKVNEIREAVEEKIDDKKPALQKAVKIITGICTGVGAYYVGILGIKLIQTLALGLGALASIVVSLGVGAVVCYGLYMAVNAVFAK